jgi:AcrR family transcriptional regulator
LFEKFLNLDKEKQERILNAAMKEFAQKGFNSASTNEIVKESNIGKGMLFHYFKSKKDLFLYLYDYTLGVLMNELYGKIDVCEGDIFKRIRQFLSIKYVLVGKHPDMFNFIKAANFEAAEEVKEYIDAKNNEHQQYSYRKVLENIDTSKFKDNIDINRAINVTLWTLEHISEQEQEKSKTLSLAELKYNELLIEVDSYIELFRNTFYK